MKNSTSTPCMCVRVRGCVGGFCTLKCIWPHMYTLRHIIHFFACTLQTWYMIVQFPFIIVCSICPTRHRDVIFRLSMPGSDPLPNHTLTPGDVVLLSKTKPGLTGFALPDDDDWGR